MTALEHQACLLLGSNILPEKNLTLGLNLLRNMVTIVRLSSVWETPSVGSSGPDFLNLAVLITTPLKANQLKAQVLHPLEKKLGRVRSANKNAPRTFDIDIILFDGQLLDPNLWVYAHRAVPVAEILPDYRSGQGKLLKEVARELTEKNPIRLKRDVLVDSQSYHSSACSEKIKPRRILDGSKDYGK
jgi:2-amino-4-hydroxy-6-hydroxymethyldihydropteridine diphosphokinase